MAQSEVSPQVLTTIRECHAPPDVVLLLMKVTCVIIGEEAPKDWKGAKACLSQVNLRSKIINSSPEHLIEYNGVLLTKYMRRINLLEFPKVPAIAKLVRWMVQFDKVAQLIRKRNKPSATSSVASSRDPSPVRRGGSESKMVIDELRTEAAAVVSTQSQQHHTLVRQHQNFLSEQKLADAESELALRDHRISVLSMENKRLSDAKDAAERKLATVLREKEQLTEQMKMMGVEMDSLQRLASGGNNGNTDLWLTLGNSLRNAGQPSLAVEVTCVSCLNDDIIKPNPISFVAGRGGIVFGQIRG